jgi:hypothetical protein
MIVDDIQVGVGRTGTFFSFERAGIVPDMVILSKSISGFGLPLSLLLMKPELDIFEPAEHNGTFRGNQLGFVGCKKAMELYERDNVDGMVATKEKMIEEYLEKEILPISEKISYRGIGMIWGIDFSNYDIDVVKAVQNKCVEKGLIIAMAALLLVTLFLITNTIKITIFSRKREIEIMRLVGASNFSIKQPFVIEGLCLGFLGSIIPIIVTIYGYSALYNRFDGQLFSPFLQLVEAEPFVYFLSLALAAVGIIVGMFGSYTAVRKYLKI